LRFVGDGRFNYHEAFPRLLATPSHSAYVKLSEGCSQQCAFCIIPQLRGPHVSRPMENIVSEVEQLAAGGVKEFNLLAQDSTAYGMDLYGTQRLSDLLRELNEVRGVHWLRLFYAYPHTLSEQIIRAMAELTHVAKYVDMPLQHGSDEVLRRMRRPERRATIRQKVVRLREHMPGVSLRSTFIVGFPGETDQDFGQLVELVQELQLDHVGVFEYSREPGTPAAEFPDQVPEEVKNERWEHLMEVQQEVSRSRLRRFVGHSLEVLVEGEAQYEEDGQTAGVNGKSTEYDLVGRLEPGNNR